MVISQYLLTLICNKNGVNRKSFRQNTTTKSEYYNHYIGDIKFKESLVPSDRIIKINKTKINRGNRPHLYKKSVR